MKKETNLLTIKEVDNYIRIYGNEFVISLLKGEEYLLTYTNKILKKAVKESKKVKWKRQIS